MAFVRLDDLSGSVEVIAFNSAYAAARDLLEADRVLLVKGRVDHKDGEMKLIALEVTAFEAVRRAPRGAPSRRCPPGAMPGSSASWPRSFAASRASRPSSSRSTRPMGPRMLAFGPDFRVRPEPDFFAEVKALLGEAAVA